MRVSRNETGCSRARHRLARAARTDRSPPRRQLVTPVHPRLTGTGNRGTIREGAGHRRRSQVQPGTGSRTHRVRSRTRASRRTQRRPGRDYTLNGLLLTLPVPGSATELLDLTGRWCRERAPQRRPSPTAPGCARPAAGAPATTPPCPGSRHTRLRLRHPRGTGPGAATTASWPSDSPPAVRSSPAANCCCRARSPSARARSAPARGCTPPTVTRGSTASPPASTTTSAPAQATPTALALWCSTPGRPSASITTSTASPTSPTAAPRSAWGVSSWTAAGSATAATTGQGSATGTSTRPSGRRAFIRSSTTSAASAWSSACGSNRK